MTSSKSHEGGKLSISSLNGGWEPITGDSHEKLVIKNTLLTPNRGYSYQKNWKTIHLWKKQNIQSKKSKKQKQKKKNNTFQTNQTNPKHCKKQLQTNAKTQKNQRNNTEKW